MGAGMPIGAFISSNQNMATLASDPPLGHITTFGGHPISCAAALATFKELQESEILKRINKKNNLFRQYLTHPKIKNINSCGLMLAIEFENEKICQDIVKQCLGNGVITFYFLFIVLKSF